MEKTEIWGFLDGKSEDFSRLSDEIWNHPETCFEETVSAELLCKALEKEGFTVEKNIAGMKTAFIGRFGHGKPVIGFLAEFDALSGMSQEAGLAEKKPMEGCKNGHGCGHNLLGVGSLAGAVGFKRYLEEQEREGTILYFGCPAEEGGSGKSFMAREGCFDGLDCALCWHPGDFNKVMNASCLANYQIYYHFKGISAHAASAPPMGRSALDAVELMNTGVQYLREHIIPEARVHYAVTNTGGFSPNVVQAEAEVLYLIRAPRNEQVEEIYRRVNKIAQGAALMTETELEIDFVKGCSNLVPNDTLCEVMYQNLSNIPLPEYTEEEMEYIRKLSITMPPYAAGMKAKIQAVPKERIAVETRKELLAQSGDPVYRFVLPLGPSNTVVPASTDVGDVSWNTPTVQCQTVTWPAGTPGHSWQAVTVGKSSIAHKGMLLAGKVLAATAIDLAEHPEIIEKAKEELCTRLAGAPYQCPIPPEIRPRSISK